MENVRLLFFYNNNLEFFDIFEIGVAERVEKEVDFKHATLSGF